MKLDEFLKALETCPDGKLQEELGISDNWPIFLKTNIDHVVRCLNESESFKHFKDINLYGEIYYLFKYVPGTVKLQVVDDLRDTNCSLKEDERYKLQSRGYRTTTALHPYQDIKIEGVNDSRAIAMAVVDVSRIMIRERIPICVPKTLGFKYHGTKEYPRTVYYKPRLPVRTRK